MTDNMPYSPEAEKSLLACLLSDPILARKAEIETDDFYLESHRMIFNTLHDLACTDRGIDLKTVCIHLDEHKKLADVGGPAAIMAIIADSANPLYYDSYLETVKDRAKRRKAIRIAETLANHAFKLDDNMGDGATRAINDLVRLGRSASGAVHINEYLSRVYDMVEARCNNPKDIYGIPSGFKDLDMMVDGIQKKSFYILSGEPGVGKSLFGIQMCINMAGGGHPGAIYELEMPGEQVTLREVSHRAKIKTDTMRRGRLQDDDWTSFCGAVDTLGRMPVYMSDSTDWTTTGIRADLSRLKATNEIEWALIDYLFLLNDLPGQAEIERTNYCSRALKAIAKDLDIAVIAIHSMVKTGFNGGAPNMGALRGSAQVSYDADDIWMMTKDQKELAKRWITPVKARERDKLERIALIKLPGYPAFGDVATQREVGSAVPYREDE